MLNWKMSSEQRMNVFHLSKRNSRVKLVGCSYFSHQSLWTLVFSLKMLKMQILCKENKDASWLFRNSIWRKKDLKVLHMPGKILGSWSLIFVLLKKRKLVMITKNNVLSVFLCNLSLKSWQILCKGITNAKESHKNFDSRKQKSRTLCMSVKILRLASLLRRCIWNQ